MRLLVISSRYPYPLEKGDKLRLYFQLQELAKHFDITLVSITDRTVTNDHLEALRPYCKSIHIYPLSWHAILINVLIGYARGLPAQIAYFFDKKIKGQIDKLIENEKPDHIYCQLIRASEYVKDQKISKTLDYMDCFSMNSHKRAENSGFWSKWFWRNESIRLIKYESNIYPYFDHHTIISAMDTTLMNLHESQPLSVISNGISDQYFKTSGLSRDIDLLFLGNLSYYSNVKAVEFLIHEVIPLIVSKNKDFRIIIAGAHPLDKIRKWIKGQSNILLMADVENTKDIYDRSKVFIAPITLGTGQQNKVLEAMASGCTVLCSYQVAASLPSIAPHLSIAESAKDYAQHSIDLWNQYDQDSEARSIAMEKVNQNFNWEKNTMELVQLIKN